jgi:outer membrane immunogenic protein
MRKLFVSVAALALTAGTALAADLPSRKGPPVLPPPPPPPPMWTGFYAGLNAGYNFGTNSNVQSAVLGQDAVGFGGVNVSRDMRETAFAVTDLPTTALLRGFGEGVSLYTVGFPTGAGLAQSGSFANTQSGFIGGGQIGYNYQWGSNFVIGIEADIQGTGIRGTSHGGGAAGGSTTSPLVVFSNGGAIGNDALISDNKVRLSDLGINNSANSIGATTVHAGVDWLGTVRGRLGYLWTPTMLLYATGGLTYGGVYANVNQWANTGLDVSLVNTSSSGKTLLGPIGTNHTFIGGGNKSQTLVGWNVGGGIEWMFMPNWSLKAEGIDWNMGNMNVPTASFAAAPVNLGQVGQFIGDSRFLSPLGGLSAFNGLTNVGHVRVNYQGVIARVGVNYHFNWGSAAPIVAKY